MARQIVINAGISETRVAVLDGGVLTELFVERRHHRSIVGNVYKGVVTNVLPGMQAAFVDVGLAKDAFLYAGDFIANLGEYERMMLAEEDAADLDIDGEEAPANGEGGERAEAPPVRERRVITPIEDVLRKGQEILVQVSKESLGTKGARITSFISLPGRYLVYMPQVNHLGVSRRIHDAEERDRLRQLVRNLRPPAGGGSSCAPWARGAEKRSSAPTSSSSSASGSRCRRGSPRLRPARSSTRRGISCSGWSATCSPPTSRRS